ARGTSDHRPLTVGGPACDGSDPRPNPGRLAPSRPVDRAGPWPRAGWPDGQAEPPVSVPRLPLPFAAPGDSTAWMALGPGAHDSPALSTGRNGASVSLVIMPAQTRSQIAAATAWSLTLFSARPRLAGSPVPPAGWVSMSAARSASPRKNSAPPPPSTLSTASC